MKKVKYFIILAGLLIAFLPVMAQKDSSGIYKTAADFKEGKLTYAINYKTEKHKINDNVLFNGDKIKIVHHGQSYTMDKDSTYGFKNTSGETFRFIDRKEYEVLNPANTLLLYVYKHLGHSPKEAEKYPPMYFFSTDAASAPQSLTKANLKEAYPDNHPFHDALDAQINSDKELCAYDDFHKMYKRNWLMKENMQ